MYCMCFPSQETSELLYGYISMVWLEPISFWIWIAAVNQCACLYCIMNLLLEYLKQQQMTWICESKSNACYNKGHFQQWLLLWETWFSGLVKASQHPCHFCRFLLNNLLWFWTLLGKQLSPWPPADFTCNLSFKSRCQKRKKYLFVNQQY